MEHVDANILHVKSIVLFKISLQGKCVRAHPTGLYIEDAGAI